MLAAENSGAYFGAIAGRLSSLPWHSAAIIGCFIIMAAGVSSGIEKVNKVMMPAFFGLFIILAIRVATLPKAADGYTFLFKADWSKLADVKRGFMHSVKHSFRYHSPEAVLWYTAAI